MNEMFTSRCLFCSLGCPVGIRSRFGEPVGLHYAADEKATGGALCAKGNYLCELMTHPLRLVEPRHHGVPVGWETALNALSDRIKESGPDRTAVVLGGEVSAEDARTAAAFTAECLGGALPALHVPTGDDLACGALAASGTPFMNVSFADIAAADCILAVGDPFEIAPVIARPVLGAKHASKDTSVIAVSDDANRTARFATRHVSGPVRSSLAGIMRGLADGGKTDSPGWMNVVQERFPDADDDGKAVAGMLAAAERPVLLLETNDPATAGLAALIVQCVRAMGIHTVISYGSLPWTLDALGAYESLETLAAKVARGDIRTVVALSSEFGGDNLSLSIGRQAGFLALASPIDTPLTGGAEMLLPASLWLEQAGTYFGSRLEAVAMSPGGALSCGRILDMLADTMGYSLPDSGNGHTNEKEREEPAKRAAELAPLIKENPEQPPARSDILRFGNGVMTGHMKMATYHHTQRRRA